MNKLYIVFCFISALFFTAVTMPAFAWEQGSGGFGGSGSGGGWGNSDGFGGNGGSTGTNQCQPQYMWKAYGVSELFSTPDAACAYRPSPSSVWKYSHSIKQSDTSYACYWSSNGASPILSKTVTAVTNSDYDPNCDTQCNADEYFDGSKCVPWTLKCPAGYEKTRATNAFGNVHQVLKKVGDSCVPDDQPEDCDPAIQECNDDGTPKCDPCSKLKSLSIIIKQ